MISCLLTKSKRSEQLIWSTKTLSELKTVAVDLLSDPHADIFDKCDLMAHIANKVRDIEATNSCLKRAISDAMTQSIIRDHSNEQIFEGLNHTVMACDSQEDLQTVEIYVNYLKGDPTITLLCERVLELIQQKRQYGCYDIRGISRLL